MANDTIDTAALENITDSYVQKLRSMQQIKVL
jgi:hypothetical protein